MKVTITTPGVYMVRSAILRLKVGDEVELGERGSVSLLVREEESPYQQYNRENEAAEALRETREMAPE